MLFVLQQQARPRIKKIYYINSFKKEKIDKKAFSLLPFIIIVDHNMIPSTLAVLIYQILTILGEIVTYIVYYRKDLDTKLMYEQSPKDLVLSYRKFKQSTFQRMTIVFLTVLALAIGFISTIMSEVTAVAISTIIKWRFL